MIRDIDIMAAYERIRDETGAACIAPVKNPPVEGQPRQRALGRVPDPTRFP